MNASKGARAQALQLAADVGFAEAGRRLGVPSATIRSWAKRATDSAKHSIAIVERKLDEVSPPQASAAPATMTAEPAAELVELVDRQTWAARRPLVLEATGRTAAKALAAAETAIERNDSRRARDFSVCFGVLVDKAQLLAGDPTSRSQSDNRTAVVVMTPDQLAARAAAVRAELAAIER